MIRVFMKDGTVVEVPKAEDARFVFIDELQIKATNNSWSTKLLASFQTADVRGYTVEDDPKEVTK